MYKQSEIELTWKFMSKSKKYINLKEKVCNLLLYGQCKNTKYNIDWRGAMFSE